MDTIKDTYGNEHSIPGPFNSLDDIKRNNRDNGYHFFSEDTIRFFNSRISRDLFGGRLFVTSEKGPDRIRRYSIRVALEDGRVVNSEHGFQAFQSLAEAKREARDMVR